MPGEDPINAGGAAAINRLNGQAAAVAAQASATDAAMGTADHAQHDADRAAYMAALAHRDRAVNWAEARCRRQHSAYADAMVGWRVQVTECKCSHRSACALPAPNPADFSGSPALIR